MSNRRKCHYPNPRYRPPKNTRYLCKDCKHNQHDHELNTGFEKNGRKKSTTFNLYCLPYGDLMPKIPRKITKLLDAGLMKSICFDDLNDEIKKAVEELFPCLQNRDWRFFRCKSTSVLEIATEPDNGWNVSELKRIAGVRKKLYLGTIDGPIQTTLLNPLTTNNSNSTTIFCMSMGLI